MYSVPLGGPSSPKVKFAGDSPLEQAGFELVVPPSFRSCPDRPRDDLDRHKAHRRSGHRLADRRGVGRANFDDVSAGGLRRTLLAMCLLKSSSKSDRSTNLLERRNTRRDLYLRPLPGGRKTDQNSSARGSHGRLRPLPPSERLLHLSSQTPMHADPEADHQALGA